MPDFRFGQDYPVTKTEAIEVSNRPFLVAEVGLGKRTHRRVIGEATSGHPSLTGKPILYVDSYGDPEQPRIYAYARHKVTFTEFVRLLDRFILDKTPAYKELKGREFPVWTNGGGGLIQSKVRFPLTSEPVDSKTSFFRISIPFGDIAIEFTPTSPEAKDELTSVKVGKLPRLIESPLFGCDLSQTSEACSLFAQVHWAGPDQLPAAIVTGLIKQMSAQPAIA